MNEVRRNIAATKMATQRCDWAALGETVVLCRAA
jgi:hypothetical protein